MNFRRITGRVAAATLSAAAFAAVPLLAHAGPASDVASEIVRFDDLNITSEAGLATLYRRIQNAARTVCGPPSFAGTRVVSQDWKDCVSASVRNAIRSINMPQLTSYYARRLWAPVSRTAG